MRRGERVWVPARNDERLGGQMGVVVDPPSPIGTGKVMVAWDDGMLRVHSPSDLMRAGGAREA